MKKRLIYWLAAIPLIFTACVEDEYAEGSRTPIQFTVNMAGDKGITRSNTVNDAWTNGDPVAVQMTSEGSSIVKKYKIVTGSTIKLVPDTGVEPFYWPNSSTTSVTRNTSAVSFSSTDASERVTRFTSRAWALPLFFEMVFT